MPLSKRSWRRGPLIVASALATLSIAGAARADPKEDCVRAHADGQRDMQAGHLATARDQFTQCARDVCPAPVANDCATFLEAAERAQPTVVLGAHDAQGRDLTAVQVLLDGAPFAPSIGPRAVPVDPGDHVFRFVDEAGASVDVHAVVREGEKDRVVLADFPRAPLPRIVPQPVPAPASRPWTRPVGLVVGGAGVVALGIFAGFAISATIKANQLESTCAPHCGPELDQVNTMRDQAKIADVALIGSAVLLSTAAVLLLVGRGEASSAPFHAAAPVRPGFLTGVF